MSRNTGTRKLSSLRGNSTSEFNDLLRDCDQMSMMSAQTQDTLGHVRSTVQVDPAPRDPQLSKALAGSFAVQVYKYLTGACCTGMEGNYATQMLNDK